MLKDRFLRVHLSKRCFLDVLDVRVNFSHLKSLGNMITLSISYGVEMYKLNAILCSNFCDNTMVSGSSKRKRFCSDLNHITNHFDKKIMIRSCVKKNPSEKCLEIIKTEFSSIDYCLDVQNSYEISLKDSKDVFKLKDPICKNIKLKEKDITSKGYDDTPKLGDFYKSLKMGKKLSLEQLQKSLEDEVEAINLKYGFDTSSYEAKSKELEELITKIDNAYFDAETEQNPRRISLCNEMVIKMYEKEFKKGAPRYYYKYGKYIREDSEIDFLEKVQSEEKYIDDYDNEYLIEYLPYMDSDGFENIRNYRSKIKQRKDEDKVDFQTYAQMLKKEKHMKKDLEEDEKKRIKAQSSKILVGIAHKNKDQAYLEMVNIEVDMSIKMEELKKRKIERNKNRKHISNYAFNRFQDKYPIVTENRFKALTNENDSETDDDSHDSEDFEFEEEPVIKKARDCDIVPNLKNYEMALNCLVQVKNIEEVFCDVKKHVKQRQIKKENPKDMPLRLKGHAPEMRGKNYFGLLARLFQMMERRVTCTSVSRLYNIKGKNLKYAYGNAFRIKSQIPLDLISLSNFQLLT